MTTLLPSYARVSVAAVRCSLKIGSHRFYSPEPATVFVDVVTYPVSVDRRVFASAFSVSLSAPTVVAKNLARVLAVEIRLFAIPGRLGRVFLPSPAASSVTSPTVSLKLSRTLAPSSATVSLTTGVSRTYILFAVETRFGKVVTRVKKGDKIRVVAERTSGSDLLRTVKDGVSLSVQLVEDPR